MTLQNIWSQRVELYFKSHCPHCIVEKYRLKIGEKKTQQQDGNRFVERILEIVLCRSMTKNYFQYPFHFFHHLNLPYDLRIQLHSESMHHDVLKRHWGRILRVGTIPGATLNTMHNDKWWPEELNEHLLQSQNIFKFVIRTQVNWIASCYIASYCDTLCYATLSTERKVSDNFVRAFKMTGVNNTSYLLFRMWF